MPAGRTDALLHHVDEGGDVVLGGALPLEDGLDGEIGPFPDRHGVGGGHDPELGPGLGGQDLDLQPGAEPGLVGEEAGDLRQCVALYQGGPSSCRTLYEPETARTRPIGRVRRRSAGDAIGTRRAIGGDELHEALDRARRRTMRRHAASTGVRCASSLRPKDGGPLRCIPCSLVIAGVRTRRRVR